MGKFKEKTIEMEEKKVNVKVDDFSFLRTINVNHAVEKKGNLSYVSWANAYDILMQLDPRATYHHHEFEVSRVLEGKNNSYLITEKQKYESLPNGTAMVYTSVFAFGKTKTAHLPVMDYKNKAIANFDSFQLNTALQRCLAKAISLHGIGLYIYTGEDLPPNPEIERKIKKCKTLDELKEVWESLTVEERNMGITFKNQKKEELSKNETTQGEVDETKK